MIGLMTPANERKAKEREAKRAAGLIKVEVWVPVCEADKIKALAAKMKPKAPKATTTA
ncbi:MAG TPA: hypothetical protein PK225_03885 [Azonexus sp.]|nr:hypothetical protein [Azonexus sp.]